MIATWQVAKASGETFPTIYKSLRAAADMASQLKHDTGRDYLVIKTQVVYTTRTPRVALDDIGF